MSNRKISTTIYPSIEQAAALAALSRATRVPVSEYVRDGIELVLAKEEPRAAVRAARAAAALEAIANAARPRARSGPPPGPAMTYNDLRREAAGAASFEVEKEER